MESIALPPLKILVPYLIHYLPTKIFVVANTLVFIKLFCTCNTLAIQSYLLF